MKRFIAFVRYRKTHSMTVSAIFVHCVKNILFFVFSCTIFSGCCQQNIEEKLRGEKCLLLELSVSTYENSAWGNSSFEVFFLFFSGNSTVKSELDFGTIQIRTGLLVAINNNMRLPMSKKNNHSFYCMAIFSSSSFSYSFGLAMLFFPTSFHVPTKYFIELSTCIECSYILTSSTSEIGAHVHFYVNLFCNWFHNFHGFDPVNHYSHEPSTQCIELCILWMLFARTHSLSHALFLSLFLFTSVVV